MCIIAFIENPKIHGVRVQDEEGKENTRRKKNSSNY